MSRLRVGVLRGGPSSEYDVSLKNGAAILAALNPDEYETSDIFIDREGYWHVRGVPVEPVRVVERHDLIFNGLRGQFGEDGNLQRFLDSLGVPYTGSGTVPSALVFNKWLAKQAVAGLGIKTPRGIVLEVSSDLDDRIADLWKNFPQPSVIKPATSGSSIGVQIARSFPEFEQGIKVAFSYAPKVLVEEYIKGIEVTCGILDSFRGASAYALLPVQISLPQGSDLLDYQTKTGGQAAFLCPSSIPEKSRRVVEEAARRIHEGLHLRHYSRSDFILSPRGLYFLETNTHPAVHEFSPMYQSLAAVGSSLPQFVGHVAQLALSRA